MYCSSCKQLIPDVAFGHRIPRSRVGFSVSKGPGGFLSRLICLASGSKASHAWVLYYDLQFERDMVIEAHQTGVRLIPFDIFQKKNKIVEIWLPRTPIDSGLWKAADWIGAPYDFLSLFGMLMVMIGRRIHRRWKNPFRSGSAQYCSEFVGNTMVASKYPSMGDLDPVTCTPKELMDIFASDGSQRWSFASIR